MEQCPRGSVLRGRFGRAAGEVYGLGGVCDRVDPNLSLAMLDWSPDLLPSRGGDAGYESSRDSCAWDQGIIGFEIRSGARIDAISPLCADVYDWVHDANEPPVEKLSQYGARVDT